MTILPRFSSISFSNPMFHAIDLQGWQLDKLAADPKKKAQDVEDESSDEEDIPFACFVCRKPYTDPVRRAPHMVFSYKKLTYLLKLLKRL